MLWPTPTGRKPLVRQRFGGKPATSPKCCCGAVVPCPHCVEGYSRQRYLLIFNGLKNASGVPLTPCTNVADWNGGYVVTAQAVGPGCKFGCGPPGTSEKSSCCGFRWPTGDVAFAEIDCPQSNFPAGKALIRIEMHIAKYIDNRYYWQANMDVVQTWSTGQPIINQQTEAIWRQPNPSGGSLDPLTCITFDEPLILPFFCHFDYRVDTPRVFDASDSTVEIVPL